MCRFAQSPVLTLVPTIEPNPHAFCFSSHQKIQLPCRADFFNPKEPKNKCNSPAVQVNVCPQKLSALHWQGETVSGPVAPSCAQLRPIAPNCAQLYPVAPNCAQLHPITPRCAQLHPIVPKDLKLPKLAPEPRPSKQPAARVTPGKRKSASEHMQDAP